MYLAAGTTLRRGMSVFVFYRIVAALIAFVGLSSYGWFARARFGGLTAFCVAWAIEIGGFAGMARGGEMTFTALGLTIIATFSQPPLTGAMLALVVLGRTGRSIRVVGALIAGLFAAPHFWDVY